MAKGPAEPAPTDDAENAGSAGKGRPTPSRADREAARKRPLVPDTKEAKARAKTELAAKREKARVGYAAGDPRYLPARDQGAQRKFARDYVDSQLHLGEALIPAMVLVILGNFVQYEPLQLGLFVGLFSFILFVIGDMVILSIRVKRAVRKKFGEDRLEKGLGWYSAMRSTQMRFMRMPKAQIRRGEDPR